MSERFADLPGDMRRRKLERARLEADWAAREGPLGNVILHLRHRASRARKTAALFLVLLFLTVVSGLAFYLGLPFWQSFVDGRQSTLEETLQTIEAEKAALDVARNEIVKGTANQPGLVQYLRAMPSPVVFESKWSASGSITSGDAILIFGEAGSIVRSPGKGAAFAAITPITDEILLGAVAFDSTVLIVGGKGKILWSGDNGGSFQLIDSPTDSDLDAVLKVGDAIVIYGSSGEVIRSSDQGKSFTSVFSFEDTLLPDDQSGNLTDKSAPDYTEPTEAFNDPDVPQVGEPGEVSIEVLPEVVEGSGIFFTGHLSVGETIVIYGAGGVLLRSFDAGRTFEVVDVGTDLFPTGAIAVDDSFVIFGSEADIIRSNDGGTSFSIERIEDSPGILGATQSGTRIILFGFDGIVLWSGFDGQPFVELGRTENIELQGSLNLGHSIYIFGSDGLVLRSTDEGASFFKIESPEVSNLVNGFAFDDQVFLFGSELLRLTDDKKAFEPLSLTSEYEIAGYIARGDELFLYDDFSNVYSISDRYSTDINQILLESSEDGDATLATFLDTTLPENVSLSGGVQVLRQRLVDIVNQRAALTILQNRTTEEIEQIEESPLVYLQRERVTLAFESFLKLCRGEGEISDSITKTCLESWQAQEASKEASWWRVLADQLPPGILLLFLLATSGGLYRYNVRLAGFHDSRADALQLLSQGRTEAQLKDILATTPGEAVNLASIFLAADKVEMGTIKAKLGQAEIELAKALNAGE